MNRSELSSIQDFSDKKARQLLLKVNFVGGALLFLLFSYLVLNHYQTKLSYLFSSIEESVAQAVLRGDQHILDNMSRSIEQADDIDAVWITENKSNAVVGFYSSEVSKEAIPLSPGKIFLSGPWIKTLVSHKIQSQGFGELGTLYLLINVPVYRLLCLGALVFGLFLFISLTILNTIKKMAKQLSDPIMRLSDAIIASGPERVLSLSDDDHQFSEIQKVSISFHSLLLKKEESELVAKTSLRDAVKGRIASVVVHDVRQRLHNAFAAVEVLKRKTGALKELSVLHTALTSIDQTIVDIPKVDLSNLPGLGNYPSLDNRKPTLIAFPIVALVKPVVREYQTNAEVEGRDISIKIHWEDFAAKIEVDPVKFQRVISNLLSNSFKAIKQNGIIDIEIRSLSDSQLQISISDNGIGCNIDTLSKIGTVGFTTFAADGSGTGIASCLSAVNSWNGKLTFDSEAGKGFVVKINLPIVQTKSVFADKISLSGKKQIIVVDDHKDVHSKWQSRINWCKIRSFFSAKDFLVWAEQDNDWENCAVLFDLRLGCETDGIALAKYIPEKTAKWIVTSNWSDNDTIMRCQKDNLKLLSKDLMETVPII